MFYRKKKEYTLKLTEAQILWLEQILGRAFDSFFEKNIRERKHCDNIYDKIEKELELESELNQPPTK